MKLIDDSLIKNTVDLSFNVHDRHHDRGSDRLWRIAFMHDFERFSGLKSSTTVHANGQIYSNRNVVIPLVEKFHDTITVHASKMKESM